MPTTSSTLFTNTLANYPNMHFLFYFILYPLSLLPLPLLELPQAASAKTITSARSIAIAFFIYVFLSEPKNSFGARLCPKSGNGDRIPLPGMKRFTPICSQKYHTAGNVSTACLFFARAFFDFCAMPTNYHAHFEQHNVYSQWKRFMLIFCEMVDILL